MVELLSSCYNKLYLLFAWKLDIRCLNCNYFPTQPLNHSTTQRGFFLNWCDFSGGDANDRDLRDDDVNDRDRRDGASKARQAI